MLVPNPTLEQNFSGWYPVQLCAIWAEHGWIFVPLSHSESRAAGQKLQHEEGLYSLWDWELWGWFSFCEAQMRFQMRREWIPFSCTSGICWHVCFVVGFFFLYFFPLSPIHIDQLLNLTGLLVEFSRGAFSRACCNGKRGNGLSLEESWFKLSVSKDFLTVGHLVSVLHP